MEQTGSTLFQTLSGLLLDSSKRDEKPSETTFQYLLNIFIVLNMLQLATIILLTYLQYRKDMTAKKHIQSRPSSLATDHHVNSSLQISHSTDASEETPLLATATITESQHLRVDDAASLTRTADSRKGSTEMRRGLFIAMVCVTLVISAWILFMVTAWYKLGQRRGEH